jgi:hypothetical protein
MEEQQVEGKANSLHIRNFTIADDILYRQVENEAVLLHVPSGMYYSLNEMGVRFWEALRTQPPAVVIEQIVAEYAIEYSQVHHDLLTFLNDLADYGIISWSSD